MSYNNKDLWYIIISTKNAIKISSRSVGQNTFIPWLNGSHVHDIKWILVPDTDTDTDTEALFSVEYMSHIAQAQKSLYFD